MKHKDLLITLSGGLCILSGLSIFGSYYYFNNKMQSEIQKAVDSSAIYVASSDSSDSVVNLSNESSLIDFDTVVETVDADQDVEIVASYSNVIEIPQLEIKAYINEGVEKEALARGVGHHRGTANVGESGNCVIAGHSSATYNCIFNRLDEIKLLDEFYLYDSEGVKHRYYVVNKFICDPGNTSILGNSDTGISTATIYTCANKGTQRLVVVGKEFDDAGLEQFKVEMKENYMRDMLTLNDNFNVESVSKLLELRSLRKYLTYDLQFLGQETEPINKIFYGVVLGSDNPHEFDRDYAVNFGFTLKELERSIENDISEN